MAQAVAAAEQAGVTLVPRSRDETARFFAGLDLVDPGVVPVLAWRPDAGLLLGRDRPQALTSCRLTAGWSVDVDLVAAWGQDIPLGAKRVDALAVGVAGLFVAHEVVHRVALVGDLGCAVGPFGGSEQ